MEIAQNIKRFRELYQSLKEQLPLIKKKLIKQQRKWERMPEMIRWFMKSISLNPDNIRVLDSYKELGKLSSDLIEYFRRHPELEKRDQRSYTNVVKNKHSDIISLVYDVERIIGRSIFSMPTHSMEKKLSKKGGKA